MDEYFQSWVFSPTGNSDSFWQAWIDENPEKGRVVEEARSTLLRLNFSKHELPAADVSELWDQIRNPHAPKVKSGARKFMFWYGAAAVIVIMGGAFLFSKSPETRIEYQTAFGETKTITLPDSSTVILNSNSSLWLAGDWDPKTPREVSLNGEAFFNVIHKHNNQPFKVKTDGEVDIEVLGTTFNVYHRNQTKIVLNSGRIQLRLPLVEADQKIVMKPGELVEYNEKKYTRRSVDPEVYSAWTEHNLMLNRTSLREMLHMIKDNYGIEVQAKETLLDQTISGSMPMTNSEQLLKQIAKAFQLRIVKSENRIYLQE